MPREWAGESDRDRSVQAYVESLIVPERGARTATHHPVTLLLGPRGSGKTTLLRAMAAWADSAPVARLDLADLARDEKNPIDVLSELAFKLEPRKQNVPRLSFPAFTLVRTALGIDVDPANRAAARRQLDQELAGTPRRWLDIVNQVAQIAASFLGLPSGVSNALQLLPLGEQGWLWGRVRWKLASIRRRSTAISSALDFLIELNLAYNSGADEDRARTERIACEVFLHDLRRRYAKRAWAVRCLILLDNADNALGGEVLRLLLEKRHAAAPDPLVVLATAGSYPETLQNVEYGWQHRPGGAYPGVWPPGTTAFTPTQAYEGLRVGQLRDLTRGEVEQQVAEVLKAPSAPPPRDDSGVRWLGWAVHELTRGQPAGTARVLAALYGFDATVPWEQRLARIWDPSGELVRGLLDRLLPIDTPEGLRELLASAAAAPDLAQALITRRVQDEIPDYLRTQFYDFSRDRMSSMHVDTGDPHADGRPETPHPLLRRLLLCELPDPDALHATLQAEAESRGEPGTAAYHALARGDLPTAAAYLEGIFEQTSPEEWCTELCRLRRAPLPPTGDGSVGSSQWGHYEQLVTHLRDDAVGPRLRTITRLLAASWIAPEPRAALTTDLVGDPYREPLGDPHATLYREINARFHTLAAAHAARVAWPPVLLDMAQQYETEPWR
ncbi:ATP-binding protein [Streptomyces sp. NPDC054871]